MKKDEETTHIEKWISAEDCMVLRARDDDNCDDDSHYDYEVDYIDDNYDDEYADDGLK